MSAKELAVITGGTSGIGSAFAMELAARGFDLLITGRDKTLLSFLKKSIEEKYKVDVRAAAAELTDEKAVEHLAKLISKESVSLLVNNAGFGIAQRFDKAPLTAQKNMIAVHVWVTTRLCHAVIPGMIRRKRGAIINVSSLGAFFPAPHTAVYNATKSYVNIFSQSLHLELKKHRIKVLSLCPGLTKTNFFKRSSSPIKTGKRPSRFAGWQEANDVVQEALRALKKNKPMHISGWRNRMLYGLSKLMPRAWLYNLLANMGE